MGGQRRHGPHRTARGPAPRCAARVDRPGRPGCRGAPAAPRGAAPLDGLALLGERAALGGLARGGADLLWRRGPSGARARDGWLAVSLARPEDVAALPAWLGRDVTGDDPWPIVLRGRGRPCRPPHSTSKAHSWGCPFAAVGSVGRPSRCAFDLPVGARRIGRGPPGSPARAERSRWSTSPRCGPVPSVASCWPRRAHGSIKVESTGRPDGARRGPARFFDLLNGAKALGGAGPGLRPPAGASCGRLMGAADVVIESARPRALEQMGIDTQRGLWGKARAPWCGRRSPATGVSPGRRQRVGFGDVAAAAGGLVAGDARGPASWPTPWPIPWPALVTAAAVLEALGAGGAGSSTPPWRPWPPPSPGP